MSFNSDIINKSVFTVDSYKSAIGSNGIDKYGNKENGYAVLKITPEWIRSGGDMVDDLDYQIVGIIQNPLKFSVNAEWGEMGGVTGLLPFNLTNNNFVQTGQQIFSDINKRVNMAGFSDLGAVYASRRVYKKSGYLDINAEMKVVDWNGVGAPIKTAIVLSRLLLPDSRYGEDINNKVKEHIYDPLMDYAYKKGSQVVGVAKHAYKEGKKIGYGLGMDGAIDFFEDTTTEGIRILDDVGKKTKKLFLENGGRSTSRNFLLNTKQNLSDYYTLRSSPSTVQLDVGNYFTRRDMIITGATFEFSKEITRNGPLYVDVNLSFSSRTIMTDDIGFDNHSIKSNGGRIVYENRGKQEIIKERWEAY